MVGVWQQDDELTCLLVGPSRRTHMVWVAFDTSKGEANQRLIEKASNFLKFVRSDLPVMISLGFVWSNLPFVQGYRCPRCPRTEVPGSLKWRSKLYAGSLKTWISLKKGGPFCSSSSMMATWQMSWVNLYFEIFMKWHLGIIRWDLWRISYWCKKCMQKAYESLGVTMVIFLNYA